MEPHTPYREASPTLQAGSLGPVVAMLQGVLKTGFGYAGAIDGIYGPVTEAVVRQYQSGAWLPVTGVMDERTWMAPAGAAGATLESLSAPIPLTAAGTRRACTAPTPRLRRATRLKSHLYQETRNPLLTAVLRASSVIGAAYDLRFEVVAKIEGIV